MEIIIVGAGGQGLIVAEILQAAGQRPIGFVDEDPALRGRLILGVPILGPMSELHLTPHDGIVVAIGDNARRRTVTDELAHGGERIVTARHPFTSIARDARIGEGSMISAGAIVTPGATIGRGALLNTKASVDHQSVLGDFAHVSAGGTVGANCVIGDETLIALGASVASGVRVGARVVVGAGAVVVRDLPDDVVAYGVPARVIRHIRSPF
jgi:sugar O-acyltransferase (sialic acid O-acetyltransferase NeuD family)